MAGREKFRVPGFSFLVVGHRGAESQFRHLTLALSPLSRRHLIRPSATFSPSDAEKGVKAEREAQKVASCTPNSDAMHFNNEQFLVVVILSWMCD